MDNDLRGIEWVKTEWRTIESRVETLQSMRHKNNDGIVWNKKSEQLRFEWEKADFQ